MSELPPIGLTTTYLLLLPLPSPNCTIYNYLPFWTRTYSQAGKFLVFGSELPLVPGIGNNLRARPV